MEDGASATKCKAELALQGDMEAEVDAYLRRKYTTAIRDVETVFREDLDLKNHLSGLKRKLLKVRSSSLHNQHCHFSRNLNPSVCMARQSILISLHTPRALHLLFGKRS